MKPTIIEPKLSRYLNDRATRLGIPLNGVFELTPRCNFNCTMCYVHLSAAEANQRGKEFTAAELLSYIREARDQGMLFLLFTGGEPLIRPDFPQIYAEAAQMGLLVSLNTNGSLLTGERLALLKKYPPSRVNISLYGGSRETYRSLCGVDAFDSVIANIRALREAGISVKLNGLITPRNKQDFEKIMAFSEELDTAIQVSSYAYPPMRRSEDMMGKNDRLSPKEAADYAIAYDQRRFNGETMAARNKAILEGKARFFERECDTFTGPGEKPYGCRAGRSSFWVTWDGRMTPCGMLNRPSASLRELGFEACWQRVKKECLAITRPNKCVDCPMVDVCPACPASCYCETGEFDRAPQYLCSMVAEMIQQTEATAASQNNGVQY